MFALPVPVPVLSVCIARGSHAVVVRIVPSAAPPSLELCTAATTAFAAGKVGTELVLVVVA